MTKISNTQRIERLSKASLRRVIEPDVHVTGALTKEQIVPDELLSIAGLGFDLDADKRARLAREELASIFHSVIMFEAVLMAGFSYQIALGENITDPRFTYALHEVGEETRHSRLFIRLFSQIAAEQRNPFIGARLAGRFYKRILPMLMRRPATLDVLVLAGEEIPDLFQKLFSEHPDTDSYLSAVCRYHRTEEARHLAFARTMLGEHYSTATWTDRLAVRWIAPLVAVAMFDLMMVQPYVYETVGLPSWRTWCRVRRLPQRVVLRRQCVRAVLKALIDNGVYSPDAVPFLWRRAT